MSDLNAEVERLKKENGKLKLAVGTLKLAIQSMPNWLDEKRPEVVRCKDCKHYDSETQSCLDGLDGIFQPDWFCADGERKDGDEDGK